MMSLWRDIRNSWTRKNRVKDVKWFWNSDKVMPYSIYGDDLKTGEHTKKFHWIHFVWKTKLIVPLVLLAERFLGKYVERNIPKVWHCRTINVFQQSFDEALIDWVCHYHIHMRGGDKILLDFPPYVELEEKRKRGLSGLEFEAEQARVYKEFRSHVKNIIPQYTNLRVLDSMKNIMLTGILNDTAYKEFFNMLMFQIHKNMGVSFAHVKGKHKHLIYHSQNMFDVDYFVIGKRMFDTGAVPEEPKG